MKFAMVILAVFIVALSLTSSEAADAQKPTGTPSKGFSGRPPLFFGGPRGGPRGSPPPGFTGKPKGKSA